LSSSLKRAICFCETLDGEGGYTVWGKLVPPERSLAGDALPIGLAHEVRLLRDIAAGEIVRWSDAAIPGTEAVHVRRAMEHRFARAPAAVAAQ
jgi:predicted homoserine dehydrogenase-like protein